MDYIAGKTTQQTVTLNLNQYNDGEPTAARLTADRSGTIIEDQQEDWNIAIDSFRISTQGSLYYKNLGVADMGLRITARSNNCVFNPLDEGNTQLVHFSSNFTLGALGTNIDIFSADDMNADDTVLPMSRDLFWDEQIAPFSANVRPLYKTNMENIKTHGLFYGFKPMDSSETADLIEIQDVKVHDLFRNMAGSLYRPYSNTHQGWKTLLPIGHQTTYTKGDVLALSNVFSESDWAAYEITDQEYLMHYGVLTDDIFVWVGMPNGTAEYFQLTTQSLDPPDHSSSPGWVTLHAVYVVERCGNDFKTDFPMDPMNTVNDNAITVHHGDEPAKIRFNQSFDATITVMRSPLGSGGSSHDAGAALWEIDLPNQAWLRQYTFDPYATWGSTYHSLAQNVNDFLRFYSADSSKSFERHTFQQNSVTMPPELSEFYSLNVTPDGRFMIQLNQREMFLVDLKIGNNLWNHLGFSGTTVAFVETGITSEQNINTFKFAEVATNKFSNEQGQDDSWYAYAMMDQSRIISEFPCVELGAHFKNIRITSSDLHFVPEQTEDDSTERILASYDIPLTYSTSMDGKDGYSVSGSSTVINGDISWFSGGHRHYKKITGALDLRRFGLSAHLVTRDNDASQEVILPYRGIWDCKLIFLQAV